MKSSLFLRLVGDEIWEMGRIEICIVDEPLDVAHCRRYVDDPSAGGQVVFVGTVRNQTKGKEVIRLEFESYVPMAFKELRRIADTAVERWDVSAIVIHHRIGVLDIGDIAVVIAVSTPHRDRAFVACRYIIDMLKQTVPIWKKEVFKDGAVWVAAHP